MLSSQITTADVSHSGPHFVSASVSVPEKVVLHVGCGPNERSRLERMFHEPGWREVRLDIDPPVAPDIVASLTDMSVVADESVDAVWSSHNLEHLYPHEVPVALKEFRRVLKPGGFVLITLPDLQVVAERILADKLDEVLYVSPAGEVTPLDMLFGYGRFVAHNLYMAHHCGFTAKTLTNALIQAGFVNVNTSRENLAIWAAAKKI
jgi:predicted SAM-dependent methyltransferase